MEDIIFLVVCIFKTNINCTIAYMTWNRWGYRGGSPIAVQA